MGGQYVIKIEQLKGTIDLGNQNDLNARIIDFDISSWLEEYPDGDFSIQVMPFGSKIAFIADGVGQ